MLTAIIVIGGVCASAALFADLERRLRERPLGSIGMIVATALALAAITLVYVVFWCFGPRI